VIVNRAIVRFALESIAEHRTVLRPIRNRLPDFGVQATAADLSTWSVAVTLNLTRTLRAFSGARALAVVLPLDLEL
jgi:hypothetical protein